MVKKKDSLGQDKSFFVKSWKEAFSIHGKTTQEDINPEYIGALISGMPRTNISPYLRIQRIPRSHNISIKNNACSLSIYDP